MRRAKTSRNSFNRKKVAFFQPHQTASVPGNRRGPNVSVLAYPTSLAFRLASWFKGLTFPGTGRARRANAHQLIATFLPVKTGEVFVITASGACKHTAKKTSCTLGGDHCRPLPLIRMYTHLGFCLPHAHVARSANQKARVAAHATSRCARHAHFLFPCLAHPMFWVLGFFWLRFCHVTHLVYYRSFVSFFLLFLGGKRNQIPLRVWTFALFSADKGTFIHWLPIFRYICCMYMLSWAPASRCNVDITRIPHRRRIERPRARTSWKCTPLA